MNDTTTTNSNSNSSSGPGTNLDPDYYRWKYFTELTTVNDFLYGNRGPFPQPAPGNPFGQLAEVVYLPKEENSAWRWNVSLKYAWIFLTRWPAALIYAWKNKHYAEIDDASFSAHIGNGLYSRFLQALDDNDTRQFEIADADRDQYRKCDLTCMDAIEPDTYPGMYATSTITLLKRNSDTGAFEPLSIYIPKEDYVITPDDEDAWQYAKYFVLQGATHRINLITHAALHFPFDPINAISKTILPKHHLLQKILLPHLYLSLPVNNAVLEGKYSLISRTTWTAYSPFVAPGNIIRRLLSYGYVGNGDAYPEYRFPLQPDLPESQYGQFMGAYYDVIHDFVAKALQPLIDSKELDGNPNWNWVNYWADQCARWVPGFPDAEAMNDPKVLVRAVTAIIWGQSVSHATDHDSIHQLRPNRLPFRLRVPWPRKNEPRTFDIEKLNHWFDLFKTYLTDTLFYEPHNVTLLKDVDYQFSDPDLIALNQQFKKDLRAVEGALRERNVQIFSPLDHLPNSIQY